MRLLALLLSTIFSFLLLVENSLERIAMGFSLRRSAKSLFKKETGPNDITCIHGMKSILAVLLSMAHRNMTLCIMPYMNRIYYSHVRTNTTSFPLSLSISVSFFTSLSYFGTREREMIRFSIWKKSKKIFSLSLSISLHSLILEREREKGKNDDSFFHLKKVEENSLSVSSPNFGKIKRTSKHNSFFHLKKVEENILSLSLFHSIP